jgi:hypothetical protein
VHGSESSLTLSSQRVPWDALDDLWASQIPGDDPLIHENYLRELVATGCATRHRLEVNGEPCGLLVTRIDASCTARELVLLAAYSSSAKTLCPALFKAAENLARSESCGSMRLHTARAGLFTFAQSRGFRLAEVVMRKTLS